MDRAQNAGWFELTPFQMMVRSWFAHGHQPPVRRACQICNTSAQPATRANRAAEETGTRYPEVGALCRLVAHKVRQFGRCNSTRIPDRSTSHRFFVGIGCRPDVCALGQRGNGISCSPKRVPRRKQMGVPSTQAVFDIHPGTRKDSPTEWFPWGEEAVKIIAQQASPRS